MGHSLCSLTDMAFGKLAVTAAEMMFVALVEEQAVGLRPVELEV